MPNTGAAPTTTSQATREAGTQFGLRENPRHDREIGHRKRDTD